MTEQEWLNCGVPHLMLEALDDPKRVSYRKLRLYACACCRLIPGFMDSAPDRDSVALAEGEADGLAVAGEDFPEAEVWDIRWYRRNAWNSARRAITSYQDALWDTHRLHHRPEDERAGIPENGDRILCDLLREIVGNPFRLVPTSPAWFTSTVVALATGIYADRASDRMPILADALQDAGCEDTDILSHCRGNDSHVRGCWVVDLLLGKS